VAKSDCYDVVVRTPVSYSVSPTF